MRRLILMRHAKSDWSGPGQRDHDRPLNGRGRRNAGAVGAWLAGRGLVPDAALVSSAARTQETWARLGPDFAGVPKTDRRELYHAAPEVMLAELRAAPDAQTVLMLGHQPGIGALARDLLAEAPGEPAYAKYPTLATAVIAFDAADWASAAPGTGRLEAFVTPAMLG